MYMYKYVSSCRKTCSMIIYLFCERRGDLSVIDVSTDQTLLLSWRHDEIGAMSVARRLRLIFFGRRDTICMIHMIPLLCRDVNNCNIIIILL